jgi:ABC-type antimicrobial peptide transport system permease subunit
MTAIRERIRARESQAAIKSIDTMDTLLAKELSRPRTAVMVTTIFALMAILLAAVGVYGVMSYEVRQRGQELAVRSAVGASPSQILRAVLWRSLALGGFGVLAGLVAASAMTRSMRSLLFELEPTDPGTFLVGAIALVGIVLLASYVPARRAANSDPVAALRAG